MSLDFLLNVVEPTCMVDAATLQGVYEDYYEKNLEGKRGSYENSKRQKIDQ